MIIERKSPFSGKVNQMDIDVTEEQLMAWRNGMLVQDAMPHLPVHEREFIISGITPEDWKNAFGDDLV